MTDVIRAALVQTNWTGDKESMIKAHEDFARDAAAQGAKVICFQELFYGPYFGITEDVKYYDYAEPDDGPVVQRFAALAAELSMVMVLPIFEEEQPGVYYNTAVVVDADGVRPRARHEQPDDVAADHAQHPEVEHRGTPPQQPALVHL